MKYIRQFALIMFFTLLGEGLHYYIPLPIPGSIYGLVLLFVALLMGFIEIDKVKDVAQFLIEIMPILFVPSVVGLMEKWGALRPVLLPVLTITVVSLVVVFAVSAKVTQSVIRMKKAKNREEGMEFGCEGGLSDSICDTMKKEESDEVCS